jgi:hypothetical protein
MDNKGVMQQIREHLAQGKSSQQVIALGYSPGSVYKVQRQMRKRAVPTENSPPPQGTKGRADRPHPLFSRGH